MATQASNPTGPHPAQMVGNAFVEQYYHILHTSPDLVYRFYQDSSVLSRPGPDGKMASVKTMDDINVVILSMDYKECKAEIKTIDAQDSYKGGVVVQVTGWLIVKDNVKRKFTQSFFLAPQDKGYFVLNDIFRYVDEYETVESDAVAVAVNGVTESVTSTPVTPDPEPSHIPEHPMPENTTPEVEVSYGNGEVVHEPSDNGEVSTVEVEVVEAPVHSGQDEVLPVTEPASTVPEDTPKKSYASIVKVMKETTPVHVPTNVRKVAAGTGKIISAVIL